MTEVGRRPQARWSRKPAPDSSSCRSPPYPRLGKDVHSAGDHEPDNCQGGILVRVDPVQSDDLIATTSARLMEMRGRTMRGWLRVDSEDVRTKRQLAEWVERGTTYARSLPAKR